jgi:hypothetical protein
LGLDKHSLSEEDWMTEQLAIVIPAFKAEFLAKTLASLLQQTNQNFTIYVCDDASSEDLGSITRTVLGARPHVYKRFETNFGGRSLAQHWDRCVALAHEPWIWLFSDDDLMDARCVESFYQALQRQGEAPDIFRFDAWTIDENDAVIGLHSLHVSEEVWLEFMYARLMGWRPSFMQQVIFPRPGLERAGNFLDLPLAWCTDDAAIIAMGRDRTIRHIPGARVSWRRSKQNITPDESVAVRKLKLRASCLFVQWLSRQLRTPRHRLFENDDEAFVRAMHKWLSEMVSYEGGIAALANWSLLSATMSEVCGGSKLALARNVALSSLQNGLVRLSRCGKAFTRVIAFV